MPVPADWDTRCRKLPCLEAVSHSDIHYSVRPPNDDPWKRKQADITLPAFLSKTKKTSCNPQFYALCCVGRGHAASLLRRRRRHHQQGAQPQQRRKRLKALGATSATAVRADEHARVALGPLGARLSGLLGCPCSPFLFPPPFSPFSPKTDLFMHACSVPAAGQVRPRCSAQSAQARLCCRRRSPPSSGRTAHCGRARARLDIGTRSCAAGSMPIWACTPSRRMLFSR